MNVTVPRDTPVTTPAFVTVAIAGLLLVQVPPVVGDNVAVVPIHTPAGAVSTGSALIFTVVAQVEILPHASVTVHVMVDMPALNVPMASVPVPLLVVAPVIAKAMVKLPAAVQLSDATKGGIE